MTFEEKLEKLNKVFSRVTSGKATIEELREFANVNMLFETESEIIGTLGYMSHALRIPGVKASLLTVQEWITWAKSRRAYIDIPITVGNFKDESIKLEQVKDIMDARSKMMNGFVKILRDSYNDVDGSTFISVKHEFTVHEDKTVDANVFVDINEISYITDYMLINLPNKYEFKTLITYIIGGFISGSSLRHESAIKLNVEFNFS